MSVEFRFNGKRVNSARQLEREFKKVCEQEIGRSLKRAARGTIKLKKSGGKFFAEGTPDQVERFRRRLK